MEDEPGENENEQMIESQKDKVAKAKAMKVKFYIFSVIAMILLGTKMVCIGVTKMNKFWVNFIEHIAILFTAFVCYLVVRYNAKRSNNDHLDKIFRDRRIFYCCIISGIFDCLGNLTLIFAILFALAAHVSPASINCLLMTNAVLALVFGLILFKEKHSGMEYLGACLVSFSVVVISLQRGGKGDGNSNQSYVYLSVFMTLLTALFYGLMGVSSKYATHFYGSFTEEYSMIFMMISGLIGSLSIIALLIYKVEINPAPGSSLTLSIFGAIFAGIFTTLGVFFTIKALSYGSLEVALLFINMRVIVQTIEEFLIFKIFPSTISCIGIIVALFGSSLMIFFEHKEAHEHNELEIELAPNIS